MRFTLSDVFRTNVGDLASHTLGTVDDQVQVLQHLEAVHVDFLDQHTLIDGVGGRVIDQLGEQDTIGHGGKQLLRLRVDGEQALAVGIAAQDVVNVVGKGHALLYDPM